MKILIIYCYPHHDSYNGSILSNLMENLNDKHEVKLLDLYQENFDPVLHFDKGHPRRNLQFDKETAAYRELLIWADHLIFIFPIWWGGMPAMLKGFIDRVFSTGFIYHFKNNGLLPEHLQLKGRTATIITTHDAPQFFVKLFMQDFGKILQKQILGWASGIKTIKFLQISLLPEHLQLKGRTATIITTHDTPQFFVKLFMQDFGKILQKQVLGLMSGIKTIKFLQISLLRRSSERKRRAFLEKVARYARRL